MAKIKYKYNGSYYIDCKIMSKDNDVYMIKFTDPYNRNVNLTVAYDSLIFPEFGDYVI